MRFAECDCPACGVTYKVEVDNSIPKRKDLYCLNCGYGHCKVTWIDRK